MVDQINTVIKQQVEGISIANLLIICIWACVLVSIVFFVRVLCFRKECSWLTIIMSLLLTIYLCILFFLTLGNRELGSRGSVHWIPFNHLMDGNGKANLVSWTLAACNLFLFIPFGINITILQRRLTTKHSFLWVLIESFSLSTLIEITQKITKLGYCETEDIILNTLGGILGWSIAIFILFLVRSIKARDNFLS